MYIRCDKKDKAFIRNSAKEVHNFFGRADGKPLTQKETEHYVITHQNFLKCAELDVRLPCYSKTEHEINKFFYRKLYQAMVSGELPEFSDLEYDLYRKSVLVLYCYLEENPEKKLMW